MATPISETAKSFAKTIADNIEDGFVVLYNPIEYISFHEHCTRGKFRGDVDDYFRNRTIASLPISPQHPELMIEIAEGLRQYGLEQCACSLQYKACEILLGGKREKREIQVSK